MKKKVLNIELLGKEGIKVAAFENEDATDENKQPHYKGNGVAVWVNEYEAANSKKPSA